MKKIACVLIVMCICLISAGTCFAESIIRPMYDTGKDIKCYFEIGADGNAEMKCFVAPRDGDMMDQVEVTFKISKVNGTIYYNRTFEAQWSDVKNRYELTKEFDLSSTGNYRLNTTVKCYNRGKLVETINCAPLTDTY